jgi:hypothetical protein
VLVPTGKVLLLTNPVVAAYAQNPISVYFCYDAAGKLSKAISEVRMLCELCAASFACVLCSSVAVKSSCRLARLLCVSGWSV